MQQTSNCKNARQKDILKLIEPNKPLKLEDIHHAMPNESFKRLSDKIVPEGQNFGRRNLEFF